MEDYAHYREIANFAANLDGHKAVRGPQSADKRDGSVPGPKGTDHCSVLSYMW